MYEIFKNAFVCGQVEANSLDDLGTGKSLSEPFILASTNSQYDKRLFIDLPVQYMKTIWSEIKICCVHKLF